MLLILICFSISKSFAKMDSAGGNSGSRGNDHEKGKRPVSRQDKPKKKAGWEETFKKACIRYLEKTHEAYVARGEEPPFDLATVIEDEGRYPPSMPNPAFTPPSSSVEPAKKTGP